MLEFSWMQHSASQWRKSGQVNVLELNQIWNSLIKRCLNYVFKFNRERKTSHIFPIQAAANDALSETLFECSSRNTQTIINCQNNCIKQYCIKLFQKTLTYWLTCLTPLISLFSATFCLSATIQTIFYPLIQPVVLTYSLITYLLLILMLQPGDIFTVRHFLV